MNTLFTRVKNNLYSVVIPEYSSTASTELVVDLGAQVIEGIYIGSLDTATSDYVMKKYNIGAIVNLSSVGYETTIPSYRIDIADVDVNLGMLSEYSRAIVEGSSAIRLARSQRKNVLVHCAAGINRSAVTIGYYLITMGLSYDAVIRLLETANDSRGLPVLTNTSFRYILKTLSEFSRK